MERRKQGVIIMENNFCVSTRGLTKKYSKFTLGELDLNIPMGFSTALIGANGAGKTTLIDILCGVTRKSSGEVTYFNAEQDISYPALRERIGYCASSAFFSTDRNSRSCAKNSRWTANAPGSPAP